MKHTSAAMSTPKVKRQFFIQQSRASESRAGWYPDAWKMPVLTMTTTNRLLYPQSRKLSAWYWSGSHLPFKICRQKVLWCLIHTSCWAWLHWKWVPWGTLLGDFLKKDLLWAGEFWSGLELEDTNRNRLQETKAPKSTLQLHDAEKPILFSFVLVTGKLYQSQLGQLDPPWPTLTLQLLREEMPCNNRSF